MVVSGQKAASSLGGRGQRMPPVEGGDIRCGRDAIYGLQKERALAVHFPKPTATMLAMTRQT